MNIAVTLLIITSLLLIKFPEISTFSSISKLIKSASLSDNEPGLDLKLTDMPLRAKDPELEKKAIAGDKGAQSLLGDLYAHGIERDEDLKKAFFWYKKAAEQGHEEAQERLGGRYANSLEIPPNRSKALFWYEKAASQGNRKIKRHLGENCLYGAGVPKDIEKAIFWHTKAADNGDIFSSFILGESSEKGEQVKKTIKPLFLGTRDRRIVATKKLNIKSRTYSFLVKGSR